MTDSILRIAKPFFPRPVIYRTYDFRTNEFSGLRGAEDHEPHEENPMIGYRGCYRYVKDPELFDLELEILARVREVSPNVHVMQYERMINSFPQWLVQFIEPFKFSSSHKRFLLAKYRFKYGGSFRPDRRSG